MKRCSIVCLLLLVCLTIKVANAQAKNLLQNPDASEGAQSWIAKGEATIEVLEDGNSVFVIHNGGYFFQDVALPEGAAGKYALLTGRASSERTITDNTISGLPYINGYMMNAGEISGGRIYVYLEGQHMTSSAKRANEWAQLWGIFRIPAGAGRIRFFLSQGLKLGDQHDEPPARFDDLGVYLFSTEDEARAFAGPAAIAVKNLETVKNPTPAPQCTLKQAPTLYGIQLGMSVEQVLSLFNGSSSDADVRRMLERVKVSGRFGLMDLQIIPSRYSSESKYADIKVITLKFLDGHAFSIDVIYNGPRWKSTDEFISSMSDSLGLPAPDAWEALLPLHSKYLRCVGFEIWFFASPGGIGNKIDLIDLAAEKTLTDRQAAEGK